MPRKFIKKYLPNESSLKSHKHLSWLGDHLHDPGLWHLTRKSVSKAFFVGVFCAFLPFPLQMLIAAFLAIVFRSHIPISVSLVWLTNPITIPPVFYFTYCVGGWLLGTRGRPIELELSVEALMHDLPAIWWPLLTGSVVCGLVFATLAYLIVNQIWIYSVRRSWSLRRKKKS
jgi:uncharacterized protein (DUF2062 family)